MGKSFKLIRLALLSGSLSVAAIGLAQPASANIFDDIGHVAKSVARDVGRTVGRVTHYVRRATEVVKPYVKPLIPVITGLPI